jgi:hypothetical protein
MRTLTFIFLALCALITGCTTYNPITIAVSNADGDPVSGASVHAAPLYFFNPSDNNYIIVGPYDIIEPFPAEGAQGITSDDGTVTLQIVTKSPLDLKVLANTFDPWEGQISITEQGEAKIKRTGSRTNLQVTTN